MNNHPDKMRCQLFVVLLTAVVSVCFGQMVPNIEDKNITTFRTAFVKDVLVLDIDGSYVEIPMTTTTLTPEITTLYRINNDESTGITDVPTTYIATNGAEPDAIDTKETTPIIIPETTILSTTTATLITIASTSSTQTTTTSTATNPTTTKPNKIKPTTTKPTTTRSTPTKSTPTSQIILIPTVATKSISLTPSVDYKPTTKKIKLLKLRTKKRKSCKKRKHPCIRKVVKKQCKQHHQPERNVVEDTVKVFVTAQQTHGKAEPFNYYTVNPIIKLEEQYKGNDDPERFRVFKCWIYQSCT